MVTGDGLVNRQGRQFVEGALIQLGRVDHIAARHAVLHRARIVAAGGVAVLDLARDGADAIGQAGQGAEQGGQAVVGALGDLGRLFQQLFAADSVELRVGAQEVEEAGEVAGPAGGAHLVLHPGANAGDLFQADLMHLVRCQVGGGVAAHGVGVELATARAVGHAGLDGRARPVVVLEHVAPGDPTLGDGAVDQGLGAGAQGGLLGGGDGRGQGLERLDQDVAALARLHVGFGQGKGAVDDGAGLNQAGVEAATGVGDGGVIKTGNGVHARQPGLGVGGRGDAGRTGQIGHALTGAALGAEGQASAVQRDGVQVAADQVGGEGSVQLLVFVQRRRADRFQTVQKDGQGRDARQFARARGIGQARQGLAVAFHAGADRIDAAQPGLIVGQNPGQGEAGGVGRGVGFRRSG